jgi:uncharacterized membrane protein YheB (UPF0754 family)
MNTIITTWVVPVVVGAGIGLFTNWLALKMLFRPHTKKKLLGIPVPFTPGLLPKERYRLSKSIGETVARELITEEVLRRRLEDPSLVELTTRSVLRLLDGIFDAKAADILVQKRIDIPEAVGGTDPGASGIATPVQDEASAPASPEESGVPSSVAGLSGTAGLNLMGDFVLPALRSFAATPVFRSSLSASLRNFAETVGSVPVSQILGADAPARILDSVLDPEHESSIIRIVSKLSPEAGRETSGTAQEDSGSGIPRFPMQVVDPLVRVVTGSLYDASIPMVEAWIRSPDVRGRLMSEMAGLVDRAVGRLTLIQQGLLRLANYQKTVADALPAAMDDFVATISTTLHAGGMRETFISRAVHLAQHPAGVPGGATSMLSAPVLAHMVAEVLLRMRAEREGLDSWLQPIASPLMQATVADAAKELGFDLATIAEKIAQKVVDSLSGESPESTYLDSFGSVFYKAVINSLGESTIAALFGIDAAMRGRLATMLAVSGLSLFAKEAGSIVAGLDVRSIVEERINELDIVKIESMVFEVASRELNAITWLGALFGAIIGAFQGLLGRFMP